MPKTLAIISLAGALLAGTALMAAAQLTTVDPGRDVSPTDSRLGPSGVTDSANGALGAGNSGVGNSTGTSRGVNRNLNGYSSAPPNAVGSPSVAPGSGPPPGVSR
jgi:hypothetical protein